MTLRLRLTLLYGGCFLVAGAALLAITYGLVAGDPLASSRSFVVRGTALTRPDLAGLAAPGSARPAAGSQLGSTGSVQRPGAGKVLSPVPVGPELQITRLKRASQKKIAQVVARANAALRRQRADSLRTLLTRSALALAIMALVSILLGWLVAGRALRPLRTMSARAREITADRLDERLGRDFRDDELGRLASSFDDLLGRLERAFAAQRRFVANASHELRTPLTLERAVLEVALSDPDATSGSLRRACERVLVSNAHQERLIDALLTLARGQAGPARAEPVTLDAVVTGLVASRELETPAIRWEASLQPATVRGDPVLIERLVANLLDNAVAYNDRDHGWIAVSITAAGARPVLRIANAGPAVPAERVQELFEPFRRLAGDRLAHGTGSGLGLSIVRAIAEASQATVAAHPRPGGGLELEVTFEAVADDPAPAVPAEPPIVPARAAP